MDDIGGRPQNIVVFSAGSAEQSGKLAAADRLIQSKGHTCCTWRSLFSTAVDTNNIALLPMLIKKIPTFDFAFIIADGADAASVRGEDVRIMRDNVLFELGLCIMALGVDKVVLLATDDVRIPDDLLGVGGIGVRHLFFNDANFAETVSAAVRYVEAERENISPVVIGASVSSADGYFTNFVLRFLNHIDKGFTDEDGTRRELPAEHIKMVISVPVILDSAINLKLECFYKQKLKKGTIENAGYRSLQFHYMLDDGDILVICDMPSTVTTSYSIVRDILQLKADDIADRSDEERFLVKELDAFAFTLKRMLNPQLLRKKLIDMNIEPGRAEWLAEASKRVEIVRVPYEAI